MTVQNAESTGREKRNSPVNNAAIRNILIVASVALGFLTLLVAVLSIERARWVTPQPSLIFTLVFASIVAIILVNRNVPFKFAAPLIIILGLLPAVLQSVMLFSPSGDLSPFQRWQQTVAHARPNENAVFFVMFLIYITWLCGAFSIWSVTRNRNAWTGIITGALMLLLNLANLPRENYLFLAYFCLTAVVFLSITRLAKTGVSSIGWQYHKYARRSLIYFVAVTVVAAGVIVSVAHFMPEPTVINTGLVNTVSLSSSGLQNLWFNVFSSVQSKWNIAKSEEHEKLLFKESLDASDKIYFIVTGSGSDYWNTRRYDVYESWGWTSSSESGTSLAAGEHINYGEVKAANSFTSYTVENRSKTDVVLARGDVIYADIPLKLISFGESENSGSDGPDIAAVTSRKMMRPYQTYSVVAYINNVPPEALAAAGDDYPDRVTARYLQLPSSLPARVITLSRQLTANSATPYDKIITVKNYLRTFSYDPDSPSPPEKADGVDYFLFNAKRGVCTNFASAMAVMLRASGVPARLCTGYLSGELEKSTGKYLIRGKNTHAWVEVYFPGYGWHIIESTPTGAPQNNATATTETVVADNSLAFEQGSQLPWWMVTPAKSSSSGRDSSSSSGKEPPWTFMWSVLGIVVFVTAVYISKGFFNRWLNNMKNVDFANQAYDKMCYLASLGKSGPKESETPLEFSRRLAERLPAETEDINTIINLYIDTRYSFRKDMPVRDVARLQSAWVRLAEELFKDMLRLKKWFPLRYLLVRWVD